MALCARLAVLVALLVLPSQPVGAQGFLQSLFGSNGPSPYRSSRGYARTQPVPSLFDGIFSPFQYDQPQPRSTTYRTVCVRTCDGFYFPISNAASSGSLLRDAAKCTAACGSEARLFYTPGIGGGDAETMLDLTGRAYTSYAFAFKYRTTLVQGCQCRPDPWSEAERARHRAYAAAQAPGSANAGVRHVPAGYTPPVPVAQPGPAVAPQPVDRAALEGAAPDVPQTSPISIAPQSLPARDDPHALPRATPAPGQAPDRGWLSSPGSAGRTRSLYSWPGAR
ncbi:MAG: DUF2865 domain-containing protein [Hyphomonadaceae bacterium]|nr:DUF2865 domain-containing protein [Hyphomonadaceae bacterium]